MEALTEIEFKAILEDTFKAGMNHAVNKENLNFEDYYQEAITGVKKHKNKIKVGDIVTFKHI